MLPRKHRLPTSYFLTRHTNKVVTGDFLLLKYHRLSPFPARVAVIIGKKQVPGAVDRHRIKRIVFGALLKYVESDDTHLQMVLMIKKEVKSAASIKKDLITKDIETLIKLMNIAK